MSLLTVFKAPARPFWFVAIGATEWGHFLAIASLVLAVVSFRATRRWGATSWVALGAAIFYLTPLARATVVARNLPGELINRFGAVSPREGVGALARSKPIDFFDLFSGVPSPTVRMTSRIYETVNGHELSLDVYQPAHLDQPLPGVIVIHGGAWYSGDRGELSQLNHYLAARGYLVASVDYRLAPGAIFPAQRDDVFAAITYLKTHAKEIGLDKDRLVLLGRSAGGQIALSVAYAGRDPAIKGVVAFYAPNDLAWGYTIPGNPLIINSQKVIETYLGGVPARVPTNYTAASPLNFVNKTTPPTLMIHGTRDEMVWSRHDERLSKRLTEAGRPYCFLQLPWATHGCDANFNGPSGQLSTYAIERFLASVLPSAHEERLALLRR